MDSRFSCEFLYSKYQLQGSAFLFSSLRALASFSIFKLLLSNPSPFSFAGFFLPAPSNGFWSQVTIFFLVFLLHFFGLLFPHLMPQASEYPSPPVFLVQPFSQTTVSPTLCFTPFFFRGGEYPGTPSGIHSTNQGFLSKCLFPYFLFACAQYPAAKDSFFPRQLSPPLVPLRRFLELPSFELSFFFFSFPTRHSLRTPDSSCEQ